MSLLHPVSAARHLAYTPHYALVRANYERRLTATKKHVGRTSFRSYEPYNRHDNDALLQALLLDLDGGDVVVDVGANTGTYTLAVAASEPSAQVVAVEPHPEVVDRLRADAEVNNFDDRVDLLDCGLGETDEFRAFHLSSYDELGSFSRDHTNAWGARVVDTASVSMWRLDSFVESGTIPPPDHLKVDVEGFGLNVFRGAEVVLREHRPAVYFELYDARRSHNEAAAKALLRESGYELVPIREGWVCEPRVWVEASRSA